MNNDDLLRKYKKVAKRNNFLQIQNAELLKKLSSTDKLIVKQAWIIGERNLEILNLKKNIS